MTTRLQRLTWSALDEETRNSTLTRPAVSENPGLRSRVMEIINQVRTGGDAALRELTQQFDQVEPESLYVDADETLLAEQQINAEARAAMATAIRNVETFHTAQLTDPIRVETAPGVVCERINRPVSAVGLYVPAGSAPLPSTAIMLAVPAKLAQCPVRILCTPPRPDGRADPAVVVAARLCGIDAIFKVGGAQAIAAMAYGTQSIPKVDKVFGPGNAWVTAAKAAVAADAASHVSSARAQARASLEGLRQRGVAVEVEVLRQLLTGITAVAVVVAAVIVAVVAVFTAHAHAHSK